MDRARRIGTAPNSGLWVVALVVAAGTVGVSWDRGAIAWPGVTATVVLVLLIWAWSRARRWPFLPW